MARNPFRSEAEAYRFLLLTVAYFALIVVAATINAWLGLAVFLLLTVIAVVAWMRSRSPEPPLKANVPRVGADGDHRILVVANETVAGAELREVLREKAEGVNRHVLVVC